MRVKAPETLGKLGKTTPARDRQAGSRPDTAPTSPPSRLRQGYRILKIAPTSFFADYGCHVRIYEETHILQKMGNTVTICTYHTGRDLKGMAIRRGLNMPWRNSVQVGSSLHKLYYDALLSLRATQVALECHPHLIHAHLHEGALIGSIISRMLGVPLVFDFQGSLTSEMLDHGFIKRRSPFFHPLRQFEALINRMADAVITSSHHAAQVLIHDFAYPRHKVVTVADSVNTDSFRPRWLSEQGNELGHLKTVLGIPEERLVVVYLGLLAEYQGTGKLLEAAKHLVSRGVPIHFLIMGFPGEDYYRSRAAELGLLPWVTFTGRIPYEEAPTYLLLGDIAVSPKMSETEGNGKLLNYMAAGLPTVTFDTPVAREILGEQGIYAEFGSAESLATSIEALARDEAFRRERGMQLREKAQEEYSWEKAGQQILEIYDTLCQW